MPGTFRCFPNSDTTMGPQPPPVAPKSGAAKITLQSWQQAQKMDVLGEEIATYGNHVRCGSVDSVDSNSGSSVSSSSSSGSHCRQLSNEGEYIPTRTVGKAPTLPAHNPLQFVKVQSPLYKKAEHQIKLAKEVKISKDTLKESEEEWQSNLDNWKSRRRKASEKVFQRAEEMRQIEAEEELRQLKLKEQPRKIKTFSQIVEKRSSKRSYNLDLYIGKEDDSGVGGTPEPDEHEGPLDNQHLNIRSDTSEGMTSETDSIDSDVHSSEKITTKEPPKVPKKPHSWLARKGSNDSISHRTSSPDKLLHCCLSNKDLPPSENVSSAEPSDIEGHAADTETVSSEDDTGFCRPMRQVDSGLDSLCDSHRPNDTADSASDLSQDSCSGIDKITHDVEHELTSCDEVEEQQKCSLYKGTSVQDNDFLANEKNIRIKIIAKQNLDSKGFGFTLKGGKDQGYEAFVDVVLPGTPADIAGVKTGDKVLSLNGEPTSAYSHSSLVFSIKQAMYSGELEMIVYRPPELDTTMEDQKKANKRGSSFAQKIALFSGSASSANNAPKASKIIEEETKTESLVLRRRSAFERTTAEKEVKNRRSSCISPENVDNVMEERRHSADFANSVDKLSDNNVKKPPPPVPVKPKLKSRPHGRTLVSQSSVSGEHPSDLVEKIVEDCIEHDICHVDSIEIYETKFVKSSDKLPVSVADQHLESKVSDLHSVVNSHDENQSFLEPDNLVTPKSGAETCELSIYSVPLTSKCVEVDYFNSDAETSSPDHVDNNVNTIGEISDTFESMSLSDMSGSPVHFSEASNATTFFDNTNSNDANFKSVLYLDDTPSTYISEIQIDTTLKSEDFISEESEMCINNGEPQNYNEDKEVEIPVSEEETSSEQVIVDSDVSSIDREHFVQIDVHPLGLPLEKIDEDDGISASTTTSSDTPDTETIIDNFPTNISPLPNDDAVVDVGATNGLLPSPEKSIVHSVVIPPPLENIETISEKLSVEAQNALENLVQYSETLDTVTDEIVLQNEEYEFDESADQLSPLDVIDQIEMKLMQQLEQDALEDLTESTNGQLEEEVNRQLLYLSEDADLLDDLDAPRNVVPPSEPPPPPPEPESTDTKTNPFQRINSTKRIKKEIWRRRSDFLGLGSPEAINVDDLPPPPPGLEELLKSEMELQREQRLFLEKQLSLVESEYTTSVETLSSTTEAFNPSEEYTSEYMLEVLDAEVYDAVTSDLQSDEWKTENECQIPVLDVNVHETNLENIDKDNSKQTASPQHKVKNHIQTLGAPPKAKIMDSNKWITQTERHIPLVKQKSVDPVFREGSYNQNFWIAQEAGNRGSAERSHVPVDRRYSLPPAYGSSKQPNVTVRTWGDRESEYQPQPRPKSAIWQSRSSVAQPYPSPTYGYSENFGSHRSSWTENASNSIEEQPPFEITHQCSYCGSELTEGSAMGIDALQLYFHIECFRCCVCQLQLGNGSCGTDVQVKNSQLYCPKCFVLD